MNNPKIQLFESLSAEFVKNFNDAPQSKYNENKVAPYGLRNGSDRNTCSSALKAQAVQLRKLLLDITEGL